MEQYLVVIGKKSTGYGAHCPDVLGCATTGKTPEACIANMKKALAFHFEGMMEDGDAIPMPGGIKTYRKFMNEIDAEKYLLAHVQINTAPFRFVANVPLQGDVRSVKNGLVANTTIGKSKQSRSHAK